MKTLKLFELVLMPYGIAHKFLEIMQYPEGNFQEYIVLPGSHKEQTAVDRWFIDEGAEALETILVKMP